MLSTSLHLIFWGPPAQFAASYQAPIAQWARDLATDSTQTTNEFSVASLYYTRNPRRQITRNVTFAGAVSDARPYPGHGCLIPGNPLGACLSDGQIQAEIARVVAVQHWPTDNPRDPRNQYLVFTPAGVASCQDKLDSQCTFSQDGFCAYHSSFAMRGKAVVYSVMPDLPSCGSGQAPAGVQGNPDTDATLDSAIHEVLESATDPGSRGSNDWGWATGPGAEIGDVCSPDSGALYGVPLGGTLSAHNAFNQLMAGHGYYTQEIWAIKTRWSAAAGCVQRVGPSPVFAAPEGSTNAPTSFDGSRSYDLVGRITTYTWSYGDGSPLDTTHGAHGVHIYAHPGVYQVSLTVEDASGPRDASTETQTVVVL